MIEVAEPVMGIAPLVVGAIASVIGSLASASAQSATKAPGAAGNQMDFGQGGDQATTEETFKREGQTPWMQAVSGNASAASPTGFGLGLQQPTSQAVGPTMQEMFG